jgi:predicted RNase H-like nuclease (RuvC/YqgF family)
VSHSPAGEQSVQKAPGQSLNGNSNNGNEPSGDHTKSDRKALRPSREESRIRGTEEAENQSHRNNEYGNAAVNFGDNQLPQPLRLSDESLRQLAREFEMRIQEAQELSKHLRGEDELAQQLKNMINRMQQMGTLKFASDAQELDKLESSVIDGFQELELHLSKDLQTMLMKDCIRFAKEDDVPLLYAIR